MDRHHPSLLFSFMTLSWLLSPSFHHREANPRRGDCVLQLIFNYTTERSRSLEDAPHPGGLMASLPPSSSRSPAARKKMMRKNGGERKKYIWKLDLQRIAPIRVWGRDLLSQYQHINITDSSCIDNLFFLYYFFAGQTTRGNFLIRPRLNRKQLPQKETKGSLMFLRVAISAHRSIYGFGKKKKKKKKNFPTRQCFHLRPVLWPYRSDRKRNGHHIIIGCSLVISIRGNVMGKKRKKIL